MRASRHARVLMGLVLLGLFGAMVYQARVVDGRLGDPAVFTGYTLIAVMVFLACFNVRKKLSMLPLGRAAAWLWLHVGFGLFAIGLYFVHAGSLWPRGGYEQALAVVFYLVSLTGIAGFLLQRAYPRRLTQTGIEVIYERIPGELALLREQAEALVLECARKTTSDTLPKFYLETLEWFFRRPRFFLSHVFGGQQGGHWVRVQTTTVRRYLSPVEAEYLDKICNVAFTKNRLDFHYAAQTTMKRWLLLHLPLSAAVMALAIWHLILVHIYAL